MNRLAIAASATALALTLSGQADAQSRYYARERLTVTTTTASATPTPTPTPTPTVYNSNDSTAYKNTKNINGCSFSASDGYQSGFTSTQSALDWCTTVKAKYTTSIFCTISTLNDGTRQALLSSSACAPTWSGANWVVNSGDGHWKMSAIASAYK